MSGPFIRLTVVDIAGGSKAQVLNLAHIQRIVPWKKGSKLFTTADADDFTVEESLDDIEMLIARANIAASGAYG